MTVCHSAMDYFSLSTATMSCTGIAVKPTAALETQWHAESDSEVFAWSEQKLTPNSLAANPLYDPDYELVVLRPQGSLIHSTNSQR